MISPDDRGFTLGDGLFETVLYENGELVNFAAHMARMADSCEALSLPAPDPAHLAAHARQTLHALGLRETRSAVRLTWSAGRAGRGLDRPAELKPILSVAAVASPQPTTPARLVTVHTRRNEASATAHHKTLSYIDNVLAREEARKVGADEALMLNTRGDVACAAAANIFWVKEDRLFTPSLGCGVLPGTVRAKMLEMAPEFDLVAEEVRAPRSALDDADAIFLTSALNGVRPVEFLDGRRLPQQVEQAIWLVLRGRK